MPQLAILLTTLAVLLGPAESSLPPKSLAAEDAKKVKGIETQIEELLDGGKLSEALPLAREIESIRLLAQGRDHWEAVDSAWRVKTLEAVLAKPHEEPAEYLSARKATIEANDLFARGKHAEAQLLHEKALAIWKKLLGEEHPDTAIGYNNLAQNLHSRGKHVEAQLLHEKALAIRMKFLGEDHPDTALSYGGLALNLAAQGKYAEAQPLSEKALAIWKKLLGEEHPDTARGYNNLASNLTHQGKYAEAQPLCEKALATWKKLLGEEHADTALGYNNLALNLADQGKYAEAQPLFEKSLAIRKKLLGDEHPDTARGYNNLAGNLLSQGKYAEAQPFCEKALALWKKLLGEEHPDTAIGYNNLAGSLLRQSKNGEAQPLLEKALAIWKKLLGEEHPLTARGYNNLAMNLQAQGKYGEAQPLCEKALALRKKLLGEEHPDTATSYNILALNFNAQGKYGEAEPLYEKALAIWKKLLGEEHPQTMTGLSGLALNLDAQGKYRKAQPLHEKALAIWKKLLGEEHPEMAAGYNNLAQNLNAQGKYDEAQPLYEKALALTKKLLGENHAHTAAGYHGLAANLHAQGKYAQAEPLYEKALATWKEILGDDHPDTASGYSGLASNLDAQRKHSEAELLYEKALAIWKRLLGEEYPQTATGYSNLASNLFAQEKYAEAEPLLEKALSLRRRLLGEEHPQTALGYNNLAGNFLCQGKYAEAQPLLEKSLAIWEELLGKEHVYMAGGHNNLAWSLDKQGKHGEALEEWLLAATSFEAARLRVSTSGLGRAEFAVESNPLPALALALARDGRNREAWSWFERGLARGLFDDLSAREARRLVPEDRERERKLIEEIEAMDARLFTSAGSVKKAKEEDLEPVRQRRLELQAELSAFEKHLSDTYGVAEGKIYALEKIQGTLKEDEALLGWLDIKLEATDHWAVVVRSKGDPRWVKLRGNGEGEKWTEEDMVLGEGLADELSDRRRLARPLDAAPIEKLSRLRLSPLEEILSAGPIPARHLIVLPCPALRDVPVALLSDRFTVSHAPSGSVLAWIREKKGNDRQARRASLLVLGDPDFGNKERKDAGKEAPPLPDHGAYVSLVLRGSNAEGSGIREGDVLLAYGGERLQGAKDLAPAMAKAQGVEVIKVSLWREGMELELKVSPGKLGVRLEERAAEAINGEREFAMLMRGLRGGSEGFEPLPGTRHEVEAIAGKFQGGAVEKLLGPEASEQRLRDLLESGKLKRYRYIHFATHGVPSRERAFDSALVLSKKEDGLDGRLTAGQIVRSWSLDAELVVLSACQTAVGRHAGGEGYLGFAQALLLSGAQAVVLSLWKVDDAATSLLMERFYENLLGKRPGNAGMRKAEALREAQRWLRELEREEAAELTKRQKELLVDVERGTVRPLKPLEQLDVPPAAGKGSAVGDRPYADPYFWAAFILIGDPE